MAINTVKATVNGTEYSLTYNGTSLKWEATLTAPGGSSYNLPGGYYGVSVTAVDSALNSTTVDSADATLGPSLRLVVKEKVVPTISIVSPSASAYITSNLPSIVFQLRDSDSGVKITTLSLKIDAGSSIGNAAAGMVATPVVGGYDCTYTPQSALSDGAHTITVDIGDNDGNNAVQVSRTFTVDTVAPSLNVTTPVDNYETNQSSLSVIGTTNDLTSSPVTVTITRGGVDQGVVTVNSGNFNKSIILAAGSNTIVITATDAAGKTTSVTRAVILNTVAPVISAVEIIPNPADAGATYIIKVTVS